MSTPAGLQRFTRSMTTRFKGKCAFCDLTTLPGNDFAALTHGNKWLAVCRSCSGSITAQVRAMLVRLDAAQQGVSGDVLFTLAQGMPSGTDLAAAVSGEASENVSYDVLVKLALVLDALVAAAAAATPVAVSPIGEQLTAIANNAQATPRDRDFAGSLAAWVAGGRELTDRQRPHAERLIARYATANGAPAAPVATVGVGLYQHDDGAVRKVYMTQNDRLACKLLVVLGEHGSLQYEKGGTRTVSAAVAAGTAHLMTEVEAAAFGRLHSFCCNCCRDLDDDRSVAAGYGPVCADNNGWHYPSYEQAAAILQRPVTGPNGKVYQPPAA